MRNLLVIIICFSFSNLIWAQQRAITDTGDTVLLFQDGTWKFQEKVPEGGLKSAVATTAIATPMIKVDSSREAETEAVEILYELSPRLVRYFGENSQSAV